MVPSATRQAASKHTVSPESKSELKSKTTGTLPVVPASTSTSSSITVPDHALTGVLDEQKLPDLVLEHDNPNTSQATGAISTEEEMDTAAALLSLGEIRDDTLEDDDNAELMPIGGRNVAVDAAPETNPPGPSKCRKGHSWTDSRTTRIETQPASPKNIKRKISHHLQNLSNLMKPG